VCRNLQSLILKSETRNPKSEITAPLTFEPICVERLWGGRRLESEFGKELPPNTRIGECWEVVDRPEAQSIVREGELRGKTLHELWTGYRDEIFGDVPDSPRFPLLLKLLDASDKLSLQVHPPEKIAKALGGEPKTEFWYIAAADEGAEIYLGFRETITREQFEKALREGTAEQHVQRIRVKAGDAVFLPAGRFHAAGAGILLVEVQQNSDTTYRVFDWNRQDDAGKLRQLHVDKALRSIDFTDVRPGLLDSHAESLLRHDLFDIQKWNINSSRDIAPHNQFAMVSCLSGSLSCADVHLAPGECFLVPAQLRDRRIKPTRPGTSLLRITISTGIQDQT